MYVLVIITGITNDSYSVVVLCSRPEKSNSTCRHSNTTFTINKQIWHRKERPRFEEHGRISRTPRTEDKTKRDCNVHRLWPTDIDLLHCLRNSDTFLGNSAWEGVQVASNNAGKSTSTSKQKQCKKITTPLFCLLEDTERKQHNPMILVLSSATNLLFSAPGYMHIHMLSEIHDNLPKCKKTNQVNQIANKHLLTVATAKEVFFIAE